jgi:hypothetical protein
MVMILGYKLSLGLEFKYFLKSRRSILIFSFFIQTHFIFFFHLLFSKVSSLVYNAKLISDIV